LGNGGEETEHGEHNLQNANHHATGANMHRLAATSVFRIIVVEKWRLSNHLLVVTVSWWWLHVLGQT